MSVVPPVSPDVTAALATLRDRWGSAAPRRLGATGGMASSKAIGGDPAGGHGAVVGALATVPQMVEAPPVEAPLPAGAPAMGAIVPTGFAALDAILGPGGVPRQASLAVRGDHSSGKTTLALRLVAEAQATGSIVAWLDLARSLDPVEAVARGVRLEWLVVLAPETLDEGLAMAGALLQSRAVDLLVADLPAGRGTRTASRAGGHRPSAADRLHRLAALARRAGALLVLLEPPELSRPVAGALAEAAGLRLELARRSWIRLGRDVVGQRTEVVVARNRFGPPGRRAELRILYAEGGERDGCLARESLLMEALPAPPGRPAMVASESTAISPLTESHTHATPPSALATPSSPARPVALRVVSAGLRDGAGRPGRAALDAGRRPRRESRRPGNGHPPRDGARQRTPARP
jgi:RecA/RadA recombinase